MNLGYRSRRIFLESFNRFKRIFRESRLQIPPNLLLESIAKDSIESKIDSIESRFLVTDPAESIDFGTDSAESFAIFSDLVSNLAGSVTKSRKIQRKIQ